MLLLSLRRGEVLGLVWDGVDFDGEDPETRKALKRLNKRLTP